MIVLRADKNSPPPKSAPSPTSKPKKNGAQKAKEVLKKAVVEGTLGEILWHDEKGTSSKPTTSHGERGGTAGHKPDDMDMREFYALNDVAIWNEVLEARVLRTAKLSDLFEKFFPSDPTPDLATESKDPENDDGDDDDDHGDEENEIEEEENKHHADSTPNTASTPRRSSSMRLQQQRKGDQQLIGVVNLVRKGKKLKALANKTAPVEPKVLTLEEQLKAFETMPVAVEKGKKMSIMGRTSMRVKDFIANTRRATVNRIEMMAGDGETEGAGEGEDGDNPEVNSSDDSENEDKFSSDVKQTIPVAVDMKWGGTLPDSSQSAHSSRHTQQQVQQIKKLRKHSRAQKKSIDVVAGLFQMSNELREERESIMFRTSQHQKEGTATTPESGSDAFLNRETTLKYNDQLDEVAMTKQDALLTQKRAAVLRLKKNAMKYKFYHADHVGRFMSFWSNLLFENDKRDNGKHYKDVVQALTGEPVEEDEEEAKDELLAIKDNASKLESLFEENLGLLFETKTKIARSVSSKRQMLQQPSSSRESSRPTSPESAPLAPFLKRGAASERASRLISSSKLQTFTDSDEEQEHQDKFDMKNVSKMIKSSAKSVTWSDAGDIASNRSGSASGAKPRSLASIIERLQKMGLYSESKLKYTYGLNRKEIQEKKAEAERKRKEEDDKRKLKRGDSGRMGWGGDGGVLHVQTLGNGFDMPAGMLDGVLAGEMSGMHSRINSTASFAEDRHRASVTSVGGGMKLTNVELTLNPQFPSRPPTQPAAALPFPVNQPVAVVPGAAEKAAGGMRDVYERTSQLLHQKIITLSLEMGGKSPMIADQSSFLTHPRDLEQSTMSMDGLPVGAVDGEGTFITQVPQIELGDDGVGGLKNRLSCTSAVVQTLDPDHLFEGLGEGSWTGGSSLVGKWGYDPSVHTLPPRLVPRPPSPLYPPFSSSVPNPPTTLLAPLGTTEEVIFDPAYPPSLLIVKFRGAEPLSCHEVSLQSIFTTDSIFPESVTLRTYDTFNYPLGYLGTYPREMWGEIEENIYNALMQGGQGPNPEYFPPDLPPYTLPPQYVIPHVGGDGVAGVIPYYAIRPPRGRSKKNRGDEGRMDGQSKKKRRLLGAFEKLLPSSEDIQKSIERYNLHPPVPLINPNDAESTSMIHVLQKKTKAKKKVTLALQRNQEFVIEENVFRGEGTYDARGFVALGGEGSVDFTIGGKVLVPPQKKESIKEEATVNTPVSLPNQSMLDKIRAVKVPRNRPPLTPPRSHPSPRTAKHHGSIPFPKPLSIPAASSSAAQSSYLSPLSPLKMPPPQLAPPAPSMKPGGRDLSRSSRGGSRTGESSAGDGWMTDSSADGEDGFFTYDLHIVLIIESRRIMQLYFTKKFLQLDLAVNVHLTCYDAHEALEQSPQVYGLIFVSYTDLLQSGTRALKDIAEVGADVPIPAAHALRQALSTLLPASLPSSSYTLYVYDMVVPESPVEEMEVYEALDESGVEDVFHPPYTLDAIKSALNVHKRKQDMKVLLRPPSPLSRSESGLSFSSYESMSI